jgi:hypothetical protein
VQAGPQAPQVVNPQLCPLVFLAQPAVSVSVLPLELQVPPPHV